MRYCLNCNHVTTGEPLFCNFCGRSYDVKLCPAKHLNPRSAEVCSLCGSRDFSTPAPKAPLWLVPLLWLLKFVPGILLLVGSVFFFLTFLRVLLSDPRLLFPFLCLGLMLGLLWYLYMQLPASIRRLFHVVLRKRTGKRDEHR